MTEKYLLALYFRLFGESERDLEREYDLLDDLEYLDL